MPLDQMIHVLLSTVKEHHQRSWIFRPLKELERPLAALHDVVAGVLLSID